MKNNLYLFGLAFLAIIANIVLLVRNKDLNEVNKYYKEELYLQLDYKVQLENNIESRIYRQILEKNTRLRLTTFIDSLNFNQKKAIILFVFKESDCESCLERVFSDLNRINNLPVFYVGQFTNEANYSSFKNRFKMDHEILYFNNNCVVKENDYIKPYLVIYLNGEISNFYIIDKFFDKSYLYYIHNTLDLPQ